MPISPDRILYQDEHLLAVNKLSGELVVRGKGRIDRLPLLDFLRPQFPELRPVHRLDFETSGVVIFARSKSALEKILASKFIGWEKKYLTLVLENVQPETGEIDILLEARSKTGKVKAQTRYRVLEQFTHLSYVEATIERGQHHQIRRHFALTGHPLILDDIYGKQKFNQLFRKEFRYSDFFLHASEVHCPHPVTDRIITVEAPMPRAFEDVLEKLRQAKVSKR